MRFQIHCDPRHLPEVTKCLQDAEKAGHGMCGYMVYGLASPSLTISVRRTKAGWVAHAYDDAPPPRTGDK